MGSASRTNKDRKCKICGHVLYTSANRLRDHVRMCTIAQRAGIILPGGVDRPGGLVDPSGKEIVHD